MPDLIDYFMHIFQMSRLTNIFFEFFFDCARFFEWNPSNHAPGDFQVAVLNKFFQQFLQRTDFTNFHFRYFAAKPRLFWAPDNG